MAETQPGNRPADQVNKDDPHNPNKHQDQRKPGDDKNADQSRNEPRGSGSSQSTGSR